MSQFWFFALPETSLAILQQAAADHDLNLVLQRYESDGADAAVLLVKRNEDAAKLFISGKYSEAYITSARPKGSDDLVFVSSRHDANTIVMNGGRLRGSELEQGYLRILAKATKVKKVFNAIKRAIDAVSAQGILVDGKHKYPKVYWERALAGRKLSWHRALGDPLRHEPLDP